ncbi:MAG: hypothetical protein ABTD50_01270 [Polyangiaceae bacterium]|jgi:hypothetical protein
MDNAGDSMIGYDAATSDVGPSYGVSWGPLWLLLKRLPEQLDCLS